jgi:hypothetical protein
MRAVSITFGLVVALLAAWAWAADSPPPSVLRGQIASVDATSISIRKADGTIVTAALGPATRFATVEPRRFDQIRDSDFVGITSVPGPHDMLMAREVHIIPWHGSNEGSYPWEHPPEGGAPAAGTSMTNGTVAVAPHQPSAYTMTNANVTASGGGQLTVTYQGAALVGGKCVGRAAKAAGKPCTGVATVVVPPATPIVAVVAAKPADAKPGLAVFAIAAGKPDGQLVAASVIFEKNGVKPLF